MRRIRKMSGRDAQDPMFGSDMTWDDYNCFWQKLSTTDFPMEYKMLPDRELLIPTQLDYDYPDDRVKGGYPDYYLDETPEGFYPHFGSYQRRPHYVVEMNELDKDYMYSKRVNYIDKETFEIMHSIYFDWAGRVWRTWMRDLNLSQKGLGYGEDMIDIVDHVNHHRTFLDFTSEKNPRVGLEYTDLRFLSRMSK